MKGKNTLTVPVTLTSPKGNKRINFVNEGVTLFFNAQHHLIELSAHERAFFDYLCEHMNPTNNNIQIDKLMKDAFVTHIKKITSGDHVPSKKKIPAYIGKLSNLGLLILMGSEKSGFYCVNPKYVFKGTNIQRIRTLKQLIEERNKNGKPINMLLNEAL